MKLKIVAVVVTYFPNMELLQRLLEVVDVQVDHIVLVDNGSLTESQRGVLASNVQLVLMSENLGLGVAHNQGIAIAKQMSANFVLILDQDSLPSSIMVQELIKAYKQLSVTHKVAAVGANYSDGDSSFVKLSGCSLKRVACSRNEIVSVDHLISSGTLINLASTSEIGLMNEDLFIDLVDTEWSIRAKQKGFTLWGVSAATMTHSLGEERMRFLGRILPVHKPFRYYYIIRNGMSLALSGKVPLRWRMILFIRTIKIAIVFSIFPTEAKSNRKMILLGIVDCLNNVSGKLKSMIKK